MKNKNNHVKIIGIHTYNVGFLTGNINNLVVVDVDVKKEHKQERDGMEYLIYQI